MDFNLQLSNYINEVEGFLHASLDTKEGKIYDAMRYSLYAGGKRIRPVITLACCDAFKGDRNAALIFSAALEMIHTYSLIHDDLPCMDNDDFRRGKPTNHIVYGEAIAVLSGDALLNLACETVVNSGIDNKDIILEALKILYSASGADGMIGGQVIDIESEGKQIGEDILKVLHQKKTGALINAAASLGALSAGKDINILKNFTDALGLAFQIRDDILDVEADENKLGKPTFSDEKNEKTTYVSLYGIKEAKKQLELQTGKAISSIEFLGEKGAFLRKLALHLLKREY